MPPKNTDFDGKHSVFRIAQAFVESGSPVLSATQLYPGRVSPNPLLVSTWFGGQPLPCLIYSWNISHGGGQQRADDEYRVQLTLPQHAGKRLIHQGIGLTLLLGHDQTRDVLFGADAWRYRVLVGASPSVQVREGTLAAAYANGWAEQSKDTENGLDVQRVVAFKPERLGDYLADRLAFARRPQIVRTLVRPDPDNPNRFLALYPEAMAIRPGDYIVSFASRGHLLRRTVDRVEGPIAIRTLPDPPGIAVEVSLTTVADVEDEAWAKTPS